MMNAIAKQNFIHFIIYTMSNSTQILAILTHTHTKSRSLCNFSAKYNSKTQTSFIFTADKNEEKKMKQIKIKHQRKK